MSVATLVFFIIGTTCASVAALVAAARWFGRVWFRDQNDAAMARAMDPHDGIIGREFTAIAAKLESIDRAVNQTAGKRLTTRVDEAIGLAKEAVATGSATRGEVREMRGDIRELRSEVFTRDEIAAITVALHPDVDAEAVDTMAHGDAPPLSHEEIETLRAQARRLARHRLDHPHDTPGDTP